jgi:hypothetical protein
MTELQEERLVAAFESIAAAFRGLHDTQERQFAKQWPERKERREAVSSRVPTEEDLIREEHGSSDEPIEEWIGLREREYVETHKRAQQSHASAEVPAAGGPAGTGNEEIEGQA